MTDSTLARLNLGDGAITTPIEITVPQVARAEAADANDCEYDERPLARGSGLPIVFLMTRMLGAVLIAARTETAW